MIDYLQRHIDATANPKPGHEKAIVLLLQGLKEYEEAHLERYGTPVSEDYVLGPVIENLAKSIHDLLNGETGRLDCGTISRFLVPYFEKEESHES